MAVFNNSLSHEVAAIGEDHVSGATALALRAAEVLSSFITIARDWPLRRQREGLFTLCAQLFQAQPNMAAIINLCSAAMEAGQRNFRQPGEWADEVGKVVENFHRQLLRSNSAIAELTLPKLSRTPNSLRVLTHSASSSVEEALLLAHRQGLKLSVVCTETRPMLEGRDMAERLAGAGLDVTLIVDAGIALAVQESDVCLVGADAIGLGGVVNKLGTWSMALAARETGVPIYVLCSTLKFWPAAAGKGPRLERYDLHDAREVYDGLAPLRVHNRYFEYTPLDWFTAFLTDAGEMRRTDVTKYLRQMPYFDAGLFPASGENNHERHH
jgi:translation initiation factor 2B subunit (eIF-2B alpha/beta/delta family)